MNNAYCDGQLVAMVYKKRRGRWEICWPTRGFSREPINNLNTAKRWVAQLLHGKEVKWVRVSCGTVKSNGEVRG